MLEHFVADSTLAVLRLQPTNEQLTLRRNLLLREAHVRDQI